MQRSALRHIHSARTMHRDTARELVGIVQRQHRSRASGQQRGAGHRMLATCRQHCQRGDQHGAAYAKA